MIKRVSIVRHKLISRFNQGVRSQEWGFSTAKPYPVDVIAKALRALLDYLENNPNPSPEFIERLPRSVSAVNRKFLSVLGKRQLIPIELESQEPDFNLCRVVDREERTDVPDQTITKIVRRGFRWGEKIIRPKEVITAKPVV
ncbi:MULTISPECIES: nucleotide exchange factor GrpE [Sphaerospermopsis]|uniref:Nucleotide exchange factor GrpE n=1 Tax=Sphaerospermopsis aphanizomenoides LEGE 00250 TaxID=2777972 RepID=A0ABR9VH73_9CYAN|nr:nucleotide exchange factor GrpE [Sphaerospermopsis sp. FACHB-1194]MBE9237844.1 nucleotide exchange factor GrpE [Sphaerospermopsis aphanizomenoides LEGE 00250]